MTSEGTVETATGLDPLFRWPGGKRWLVPTLLEMIGSSSGRYFEPFVGGGALFFALRPVAATLNDSNAELIACYRAVRDHPRAVEEALRKLVPSENDYYVVREARPQGLAERAARLIFLTTHSFNGIYRVNRKGEFNVPYGHREYQLGAPGSLTEHSRALAGVNLLSGDFAAAVRDAAAGDLVYLDPPYTVTHSRNGFIKYNARVFSWDDQKQLAKTASELAERGCFVLISNADHESISDLYGKFRKVELRRFSRMASDSARRREVTEFLFTNIPERSVRV